VVDKNKKLFVIFAQSQATWKVTAGLFKRKKGNCRYFLSASTVQEPGTWQRIVGGRK
jgi:hypothetical protein